MVKVFVDFDTCTSNGMCCIEADDVFQMDDKGYLSFVAEVDESRRAAVECAADACPTQSIRVE
jgi:ferredoxin